MLKFQIKIPSFFTRDFTPNLEAVVLMETFLVSAVVSLLLVRTYLNITGFPQIGGNGFHIAHLLWGGLAMTIAVMVSLNFVSKNARTTAAILGGIGFGTFIDELGKFITSDNNYFYQPTIAIIYVLFIVIFLIIRYINSISRYSSTTYTINAIEALKEIVRSDLDDVEKKKAISYLKKSRSTGHLEQLLLKVIEEASIEPVNPGLLARLSHDFIETYKRVLNYHIVSRSIIVLFTLSSLLSLTLGLSEIFSQRPTFYETGFFLSSILSGAFVLVGLFLYLRGQAYLAYVNFQRGVLVTIFLSQFFLFFQDQLSAIFWLGINVTIYLVLRVKAEQKRKQTIPDTITV